MTIETRSLRHYRLLLALQTRAWVSAQSLAERLDVSVRTIYRDVDELVAAGLPIEGIRGPDGGYRLRPESPLDPAVLASEDAFTMYVAGQDRPPTLDALGPDEIPSDLRGKIYFDTGDWYWRAENTGLLEPLRDAVRNHRAVRLVQSPKRGDAKADQVFQPYGLAWKAGDWYVVGRDLDGVIRRVSVRGLDGVRPTDLSFEPPADFNLASTWHSLLQDYGRGDTRVVIHVAEAARDEFLRLAVKDDTELEVIDGQMLQVTLMVDDWHWLVPLLASFGPDAWADEPAALCSAVERFLADALARYVPSQGPVCAVHDVGEQTRVQATRGRMIHVEGQR